MRLRNDFMGQNSSQEMGCGKSDLKETFQNKFGKHVLTQKIKMSRQMTQEQLLKMKWF